MLSYQKVTVFDWLRKSGLHSGLEFQEMGISASSVIEKLGPEFPSEPKFFHLYNLSNTCYANSVVQSLSNCGSCSLFFQSMDTFLNSDHEITVDVETPLYQFYSFYRNLFTQPEREFTIRMQDFLSAVRSETSQFTRGFQHDAHEFFLFLLSSFDKSIADLNKAMNSSIMPRFSELFEGLQTEKLICPKCSHCQELTETISYFYIGFAHSTSLQELINNSFGADMLLAESWTCETCKAPGTPEINAYFTKLPPILVFQLQRFRFDKNNGNTTKVLDFVMIPENLIMFLGEKKQQLNYSIKSIVIHIGQGLHKGHFVTVLYSGKRWILANDLELTPLTAQQLDSLIGPDSSKGRGSPCPYLLFYERVAEPV